MEFNLHQFQKDFQDLVTFLEGIFIWNAKLHGITDKSAVILFYLYLFPRLTQEEIRELTHLSRGLISVLLKILHNHLLITRSFIPGTHKYTYTLHNLELPFQFSYDDLINEAEPLITSLKEFIMMDLPKVDQRFVRRMRDLLSFYEIRQKILIFEKNMVYMSKNNINLQKNSEKIILNRSAIFPNREMSIKNIDLEKSLSNPSWVDLYKKFLTIMAAHSFFMISDPITKRIMACFLVEDNQTQTSLKYYTGYSISTIYRYLKQMITHGLIRRIPIKQQNEWIYEMEPITLMETSYETKYKQKMMGELTILKKIAMDMDQAPNIWVLLPGFAYVYTLVQRIIRFLGIYIIDS